MIPLDHYDIIMLRLCNGEDVSEVDGWRSWMSPCAERLARVGLLDKVYDYEDTGVSVTFRTNPEGRAALAAKEPQT